MLGRMKNVMLASLSSRRERRIFLTALNDHAALSQPWHTTVARYCLQVRGPTIGPWSNTSCIGGAKPGYWTKVILMPDMNGLELISQIRSSFPPPLPIIAVWSGFPEFEAEAKRRGAPRCGAADLSAIAARRSPHSPDGA